MSYTRMLRKRARNMLPCTLKDMAVPSMLAKQGWFFNFALSSCPYLTGGLVRCSYMKMVNHYYNLATDFYEYGWGKSFHFGRRYAGEDFHASLARHEHWLALKGGFGPKMNVLDLGYADTLHFFECRC